MMWYLFGAYVGRDKLMKLPNNELQNDLQDLIEKLCQIYRASPVSSQHADTVATRRFKTNEERPCSAVEVVELQHRSLD